MCFIINWGQFSDFSFTYFKYPHNILQVCESLKTLLLIYVVNAAKQYTMKSKNNKNLASSFKLHLVNVSTNFK